jgi:hypothetical protein
MHETSILVQSSILRELQAAQMSITTGFHALPQHLITTSIISDFGHTCDFFSA